METPLVSVAMVVCNVERFLAEAIESILNQTFRDFEFIIVDFGSTDGSQSIIRRYQEKDKRIQFHVIPHCNLSEARNACCFRARGKYLALLDADDVALPDRLARQVHYLDRHPQVAILGGAVELIDELGRGLGVEGRRESDREIRHTLLKHSPFVVSTVTVRAEEFRAAGGYRRAFDDSGEDYDLWLRMMERCRAATLGEVVARFRIHAYQLGARKTKELGIGSCVARASARIRSQGRADPLDSVDSITPELLAELGLPREEVESDILATYGTRVINSLRANNDASTLPQVNEMLEVLAQSKFVGGPVAAETWFTAARAYWHRGNATGACAAMSRAVLAYPLFVTGIPWRGIRRVGRKVMRWGSLLA
jgi:glycosyltransferase involved in cell wall biosynthesis